jgi:hypothetical protein
MSAWRHILAVLWAFLGIRDQSDAQQDYRQLKPLYVLLTGFLLALVFVVGLMFLVFSIAGT